jgi:hypothetical protein
MAKVRSGGFLNKFFGIFLSSGLKR